MALIKITSSDDPKDFTVETTGPCHPRHQLETPTAYMVASRKKMFGAEVTEEGYRRCANCRRVFYYWKVKPKKVIHMWSPGGGGNRIYESWTLTARG
jgi:hypothetical protein